MININDLEVGDKVICLINSNSSLKIGKKYRILQIFKDEVGEHIGIKDEFGEHNFFSLYRFTTIENYRNILIDNIFTEKSILDVFKNLSRIFELKKDCVISHHESLEKIFEITESFSDSEFLQDIVELYNSDEF